MNKYNLSSAGTAPDVPDSNDDSASSIIIPLPFTGQSSTDFAPRIERSCPSLPRGTVPAPMGVIWIPKDKNRHMPEAMQPLNDEGMLVTAAINAWNTDIALAGTTPPAALLVQAGIGQGRTTSASGVTPGGVQYSTANMSNVSRRIGAIIIYYGHKAQYGKSAEISDYYVYAVEGTGGGDEQERPGRHPRETGIDYDRLCGLRMLAGYDCASGKRAARSKTGMDKPRNCGGVSPDGATLW